MVIKMKEIVGICYQCKNFEYKVSSQMGEDDNYERCSIDYLFLPKKVTCVGHEPLRVRV